MRIGIGIDTGGTCTDAVAMDLDSGKVLAKGKTETTREDLSVGIAKALDMLPAEIIRQAEHLSLTTFRTSLKISIMMRPRHTIMKKFTIIRSES